MHVKQTYYHVVVCIVTCLFSMTVTYSLQAQLDEQGEMERNRVLILADMGNEPDEEQQMVHMLMTSHEFELEGLIAVTGKFLRPESNNPYKQQLHPELFHDIIDAYAIIYPNLQLHATGWPTEGHLRSIVASGQPEYGIEGTGIGKSTPGSELIITALTKEDNRPLLVVVNAGSNTLAQAIIDYGQRSTPEELKLFLSKLRVYENGAQDNAGAWLCSKYPELHWVRSNYQTYCYGGPGVDGGFNNKGKHTDLGPHNWRPYSYSGIGQHQWLLEHIIGNHGPMGTVYPIRQFRKGGISFMEGGGTIPWMTAIHQGLNDINSPWWGGWGGLFTPKKVENIWSKHASVKKDELTYQRFKVYTERRDTWTDTENDSTYVNNLYSPVWRWRKAMMNDFKCRMDWGTKSFKETNHHPKITLNGKATESIQILKVKAGDVVSLDATGTIDPDGDKLAYDWSFYPEAGTYQKKVNLENRKTIRTKFEVPKDAKGKEIHILLEVSDINPIGTLYDYRRVVLKIQS